MVVELGVVEVQRVPVVPPHRGVVLPEIRVVQAHHPQAALVVLKESRPVGPLQAALEELVEGVELLVLLAERAFFPALQCPVQMLSRGERVAPLEIILSAIRL